MIALGLDISTRRIAIAGIRDDARRSIVTRALDLDPKARGARRLTAARTIAYAVLSGHAQEACVIAVEVPFGYGRGGQELRGVAYVVLEATQAACPNAIVMDVPLAVWRREVLGRGNADKDDALEYAADLGYIGGDHNIAEALCVSEWAWQRWMAGPGRRAA